MTSPAAKRLRSLAPVVASSAVAITLIVCFIIKCTNHVYTGGLKWPYFSDMGRDSPGYYVFCVGLTTCALSLACTWYFNLQFHRAILRKPIEVGQLSKAVLVWARIVAGLGMVSVIGLPMLAFFSTASYSSIHNNSAYFFFFLETFAISINTIVSYKIYKREKAVRSTTLYVDNEPAVLNNDDKGQRLESVRRTFRIQLTAFAFFFICFLLYLPIGLALVKDTPRLTIQECLDRDLGQKYCTETLRYTATLTKLWNYEDDFSVNQMRSAGQLGCILTLIGYSVSFLSHDYVRVVDEEDEATLPPLTTITSQA